MSHYRDKIIPFEYDRAICYSGFRTGHMPGGIYPSYHQIKEDLSLLEGHWKYLRLYDCDQHADTVLQVIKKEGLDFKIMLGAYIEAEMNNFGCPWGGGVYSDQLLASNKKRNRLKIRKLIEMANKYPETIISVSAGNEACVDWTDHFVPVQSVIEYVRMLKAHTKQAVTYCDNYIPWLNKLAPLVKELDFISIHTYPVWEYKNIHDALDYTIENYELVAHAYPDKYVAITEAGWATNSNGRGIEVHNVSEEMQKIYLDDLRAWTDKEKILTFVFEAFDEDWKGSPHPLEPEKHWGLYKIDRTPKLFIRESLNVTNNEI
jgi:exo-beta-1,3-glucanase (GH17 family)